MNDQLSQTVKLDASLVACWGSRRPLLEEPVCWLKCRTVYGGDPAGSARRARSGFWSEAPVTLYRWNHCGRHLSGDAVFRTDFSAAKFGARPGARALSAICVLSWIPWLQSGLQWRTPGG